MRTLRRYSSSMSRDGFSDASASGVVDRAPAVLHHQVREREVVPEARINVDVVRAAHGVDRADPAGDRAELRLVPAQPAFEAPVRPLAIRPLSGLVDARAAHIGDVGVRVVAHELAQRVRLPARVGVREREDLALRLADGPILGRDLSFSWAAQKPDARLSRRDSFDELVGAIRRGVRRDQDLELFGRVVEREQVLEPPLDHVLLVVRGDDQAHGRSEVAFQHRPGPHPRQRRGEERIAELGPGKRRQARTRTGPSRSRGGS